MVAPSSAMIPSSQRPIPLQGRNDLRVERIEYQGAGSWVIKDPVGLKYHRLHAEQYRVLQLLDGEQSLETIREELQREFPTLNLQLADVQHLITDLYEKGLAQSNRQGQAAALIKQRKKRRRDKMFALMKSLLYIRLPGWDPEPTLKRLYPLVRWTFHPVAVFLAVLLVCSAMTLLVVQFDQFRSRLPEFQQFFGWPNLIYLWITLAIAKVLHEFGHGLSCKHFGGECHEMGVMLLVFSPCLYCDVSDSWMLKSKWKRIAIGAAGMYVEVIISALAVFIWWNTQPGLLHHLALNIFFVTTITTVIFNANPLMRFDGYYMFSDWLEVPNLRPKSDKLLRDTFSWYCLGIESKPDPFAPERGRGWFVTYAVAAAVYRWFIIFGIALFLYTVLKPYGLQSIGITLAIVSIGGIAVNMVMTLYKIISAPRNEPMSIPKIATTLTVLAGLIAAGLLVPLPLHVESMFLIEPHKVHHVYALTPGQMVELHVEPGSDVKQGQVLARLTNFEKEDRYRSLKVSEAMQRIEETTYHELEDIAGARLAAEKLESIRAQLKDYEEQLRHLTVLAPCDGTVVAPPRVPPPKLDDARNQLTTWHGTPLERKNLGCYLEEGTHLLSIAPSIQSDAVVLIDQGDREDMQVGQSVELKFEHLADRIYTGVVREISDRHLEFAPELLSNKLGGELPTVTDSQGREKLTSIAYQATVLLDEDPHLLKPGMRGRLRVLVAERSAGDWLWRYLRRTFHFRL